MLTRYAAERSPLCHQMMTRAGAGRFRPTTKYVFISIDAPQGSATALRFAMRIHQELANKPRVLYYTEAVAYLMRHDVC